MIKLAIVDVNFTGAISVGLGTMAGSSSMPFTPPGHSMAPTQANAEKIVQEVIGAYVANT